MRALRLSGGILLGALVALALGCYPRSGSQGGGSPPATGPGATPETATEAGPIVALTPAASAQFKSFVAQHEELPRPCYMRVRVLPGGCQGFLHKLDLDVNRSAEDLVFESGGVEVVLLKRQMEMLRGARVDFAEVDGKRGFTIHNPNFDGEAVKKWLPILEKQPRAE